MTNSRVAIARANATGFEIAQAEIADPQGDEVLVRIFGVGICHSDLVGLAGYLPMPLPAVLGHEGSGEVVAVGNAVTSVKPGDKVVLTFDSCGQCARCDDDEPAYCDAFTSRNLLGNSSARGDTITVAGEGISGNFFGQSSFADYALAHQRNVVKVPDEAPVELLGPLGCGIQTGAGAIMRALACPAGSSLLITGAGSVGLGALLGAVLQGCGTIVVSDPDPARRALAKELGATHLIDPAAGKLPEMVAKCAPSIDFAFDTSGVPSVIADAAACLRKLGTIGLVGIPPQPGAQVPVGVMDLINRGLTVRGIVEGDSEPQAFIGEMVRLHLDGRFPFQRLVKTYPFEDINRAVDDLHHGRCIKAVLLTGASTNKEKA